MSGPVELVDWASESASPLARRVLWIALALFAAVLAWSWLAELDVMATAQGKLVTRSSLQIVQPAETGILRELLVKEGDIVRPGQVLARMDARLSDADSRQLGNEIALRQLQLRRIQAELSGMALARDPGDRDELFLQVQAQHQARRQAHLDNIGSERAILAKTEQDLKSALEVETKLRRTLPIYRQQEQAIDQLTRDGFAGRLMLLERQRDRIQQEQDLAAQQFNLASLRATMAQADQKIAQIQSAYRQSLQNERVDTEASLHRLVQDRDKLAHRQELLELKAPHEGLVKDLATRTLGSVVAAGTVLMTVVPAREPLQAEVWITHQDAGFIENGQRAKLKLAAYPFQRYGMLQGSVIHVSPDASELPQAANLERRRSEAEHVLPPTGYRTLVELDSLFLDHAGRRYRLAPGMQVTAEVHLGTRSVLEYLLAPIKKTAQEAGREP
jgi:hemolysin D